MTPRQIQAVARDIASLQADDAQAAALRLLLGSVSEALARARGVNPANVRAMQAALARGDLVAFTAAKAAHLCAHPALVRPTRDELEQLIYSARKYRRGGDVERYRHMLDQLDLADATSDGHARD
jgi:hypothetical protein